MFEILIKKYKDHISNKTEEHAAYYFAIASTVIALIFTHSLEKYGINITGKVFAVIGLIYIYGLRFYLSSIIHYLNSTPIGKGAFTLTAITVTTINLSFASQIINHVTKIQSTYFNYTKTLVSVIALPVTISIALFFGSMIFILFVMIHSLYTLKWINFKNILTLNLRQNQYAIDGALVIGRIVALIAIASYCALFLDNNKTYENGIKEFIYWFSYNFELEDNNSCVTSQNAKSLTIPDNKVVIGIKENGSYMFSIQECKLK